MISKLVQIILFGAALLPSVMPERVRAQTYPIDCAILLCLSGGWPVSAPCTRARAEFIRRVTPWPVEPPLQIWRCPMGASYGTGTPTSEHQRLYDVLYEAVPMRLQSSQIGEQILAQPVPYPSEYQGGSVGVLNLVMERTGIPVQARADIDISGPEFNFVRSIRVFDVRYARQHESGWDGDCNRSETVVLGTYGVQGDFSWRQSSVNALPSAHAGLEQWGRNCPNINHRSVFVEWRDYQGNYGFEQVNY